MTRGSHAGKRPLISCVVPVFNGERYLRECLNSILAQTWRPLEIIVVDDGSTDQTSDIAAEFGNAIRYIRQDNAGPVAARNQGVRVASGDFIGFLDADDLWHEHKLSRQIARFNARPELDICIAYIENFWSADLKEEESRFEDDRLGQPQPGATVAALATRAVFETVGPFDTTLTHTDAGDWYIRAADAGAIIEILPEVLARRRIHRGNRTRNVDSIKRDELIRIAKASLDRRRNQEGASRN